VLLPTGEEQGLLGSDWFLSHPSWPLERLAAVINLDGNAPAGRPVAWRVAGDEEGALVRLVVNEATRQGWSTTLAPPAPGSDYYPFLRRGIPAVFYVPSDGPYEGMSLTMSDSLRTGMWSRYHQPTDEYREDFSFEGLERYAMFTRDLLLRIDAGALDEMARLASRP
jgi:Zn-dependent M28 family amino/carboxypeptidase